MKKGSQVTKPIILVKICYKLLYVIQGIENSFDKVTSWLQLISEFLVAPACLHVASDWPRTFLHPRCFLFSISLLFVNKYAKQKHLGCKKSARPISKQAGATKSFDIS